MFVQPLSFGALEVGLVVCDVDEGVLDVGLAPELRFKEGLEQGLLCNLLLCCGLVVVLHLAQPHVVESKVVI